MTMTPTPAAPSLAFGEDSGASDTDGVIDTSGPLLIGQTLPNATITLYDNGIAAGAVNAVADANGNYAINPYPVLDDGKHRLTITATAPNQTPSLYSPALAIVVDTSPPDPPTAPVLAAGFDTGASAEDGITNKSVLQLTGMAEPGSIVALYNGKDDNADDIDDTSGQALVPSQVATTGADGHYSITTSALADGSYNFTLKAMDLAGNVSKRSAATSITVDTTAPAAPAAPTLSPGTDTGASHSDGLTSNDTPVVVGTTEANATVELFDGAAMVGKATADGTGAYAITSDKLEDGAHTLTVKAVDAAGNVSAASAALNVVVDTAETTGTSTPVVVDAGAGSVPFTVKFSEPVTGVTAADFTLVATGSVTGSVQSVTGSGSTYTVTVSGLDGEGTIGLALAAGSVTDLAGNAATLTESDTHAVSGTAQPSAIQVSTNQSGMFSTGENPSPSASGRLVAFTTEDGTMTTGPAIDGQATVVVRDTVLGKTALVSFGLNGAAANGASGYASMSADGTEIAFASDATNLVQGGTAAGETNIYLATLTEGPDGPKVTDVQLISEGNGQEGEGVLADGTQLFAGPILSADGSTVAFDSTQALVPGAESGTENVYAENVATGAITLVSGGTGMNEYAFEQVYLPQYGEDATELLPQPDKAPGTGGDLDSDVTSISADGKLIAYESLATDLGGVPVTVNQFSVPYRGYIYSIATGKTINVDGTDLIDPSAATDTVAVNTYNPVLSGDGTKVFYEVHTASGPTQSQALYEDTLATGVTTPVSVPDAANYEVFDASPSVSKGGGLVLFVANAGGIYATQPAVQTILDNVATGTMTTLTTADTVELTSAGNAYVFVEPNTDGSDTGQVYETNLGVSVGIDPIDGDDAVNTVDLAKAASGSGLAVTGTTNAPSGSAISVQLYGASATTNTLNSPAVAGTVDGSGHWTATVPTALLQSADGNYALVVQVGTPTGNSFISIRDFTVDTKAPDAPDAPKLDAGSDTSLASDGSATSQDTPILTGTAEAGATITLYDSLAGTTPVVVGTAVADGSGVYAITPDTKLMDGKHALDVTATDAAGNVSAASADLSITVDTVAPAAPTLSLSPGSDTGVSDSDRITSNAGPTVIGTGEAGTQITLYDTDGVAMLGTATVKPDGTWRLDSSNLSDGVHTLTATDTDKAGNVSPVSDPLAVTIDTLPPLQPTVTSVTGPLVSGKITAFVTVNGTAEPGSTVHLALDSGMSTGPIVGESTAASDGDYSIDSDQLPPGDGQNLAVLATDAAGNDSQLSLPVDVDISDSPVPPPGVPAFTPTLLGLLTDGPIAGASVFADSNGNGIRDTNEGAGITEADGSFQLTDTGGELIAIGGKDTVTGLSLPGALSAPAHSTVIDPLTTLLDAYAAATGQTPQAAQPALLSILGLDPTADLTQLDPAAAASNGDFSFLIAGAKVMDTAVIDADLVAAQTGVSVAAAFAASFAAMAQQAATGSLNLDDGATTLVTLASSTASIADPGAEPGAVLSNDLADDAAGLLSDGNGLLDLTGAPYDGSAPLAFLDAVERVEQGQAAPQLAAAGNDPYAASVVVDSYTYNGLTDAVTTAEAPVLPAPLLASGSDTGLSAQDDITSDTSVLFTGLADPGAQVFLTVTVNSAPNQGTIVGIGTADSSGRYGIAATLPAGLDHVTAVQAAPGETVAIGTVLAAPAGLVAPEVTTVLVGDFPNTPSTVPEIEQVQFATDSADDATHTSLYIMGEPADFQSGATFTVTANGTPITVGTPQLGRSGFGIVTTPLVNGTYTLVVTETATDGETLQSLPYTLTLAAPGTYGVEAEAAGGVAGGFVGTFIPGSPTLAIYPTDHPSGMTDAAGTAVVPSQSFVPSTYQGVTTINPTDSDGIQVDGGEDLVTGLPLPLNLSAPPGGRVITSASSLLTEADYIASIGTAKPTAAEYAYENRRIDTALSLPTTLNLGTADPLAMAEAGDATLLLKDIELLDTAFLLVPFTQEGDAAYTANPFYTINSSINGGYPFDDFIGGTGPAVTAKPIDFTSAATVLAWMTTYDSTPIFGSEDTHYDASVLPAAAAIIAASNAAIEAHAASATSLADTLSYALAVERVAQSGEEQALAALASSFYFPVSTAQQQAGFATLQTDYTGASLAAAVATALTQNVQVTGFTPTSASTGTARETFSLTFSAPVTGVSLSDFSIATSPGLVGAAVEAVSPVAGSDGTSYAVTVSTGIGAGSLTLGFTQGGITNAEGDQLTTGTFGAPQYYSSPDAFNGQNGIPSALAIGDFNGDGRPDVVTANDSLDGLTLYLDQPDGSFLAEPALYTGSNEATRVVTGDFNGDGKLDAATLNSGEATGDATVSVLLGNGDGGFSSPIQTEIGVSTGQIGYGENMVAGDFNGDGKLDLAVLNTSSYGGNATAQLFYGSGDGTFTAGPTTIVGQGSFADGQMVEADLNGDGIADVVLSTSGGLFVLLGNGHGGLTLADQPALGFGAISGSRLAVGDLNGDGIPDIVVVPGNTLSTEKAAVLLGKGDGTFQPAVDVPLPLPPGGSDTVIDGDITNLGVAIGDVTGDGKADIVVVNEPSGVVVLPGLGDGTFGPGYQDAGATTAGTFSTLALADVNGDGRLDLVTTDELGSNAGSSTEAGIAVSLNAAQTVLPASASVTVVRAAAAQPTLIQSSGGGMLTHEGNAYTLDLGTLAPGSAAAAVLALANVAAEPADSFDGAFSNATGGGFTLTGGALAAAIAAGQSQGGITLTADTSTTGNHSETITFAPRDTTATPADDTTPDDDSGTVVAASVTAADPVADELAPLTLTITDDVVEGGVGTAILAPVPAIALPNVRVGGTDSEAITISNTATAPAADLDVTAMAAGDVTVTGSVSGLAPQASDTTSLIAGLTTAAAGSQSGTITLAPVSEPSTALTAQNVAVSGSVYRPATAVITPIAAFLHVGDAGLLSLGIANTDPADGFSEDLRATLTSVSGPFNATAGESTGVVSAGALSSALTVGFSTMVASLLTGSATVGLVSDGGTVGPGLDGLGTLSLPSQTAPLSVTVDNYASALLQLLSGTGVLAASGTNYTLDLGTVAQGTAPLAEVLGVVNAASGPADLLSGHFALSGANAIGLTGFGDFAGLASEQSDGGLDVSLDTSGAGTFTRTVTLTPTGSNASGYSGALTPETLTITGTVAAATSGSSPGGTTGPTGNQPGTSTPSSTTPVYRFFDTIHGTHLFTQSLSEAQNILSNRPDLMEETNNFGAVNPQTDPNAQVVYRFFEASNGTHFLTASYQEYLGLTTAGSSTYRPDLTYEANSTFYEHTAPQSGDIAVYRFFDTVQGTQYLTGSQSEYAALTTVGSSTYRPDLVPEGTAFYAPGGSFST